MGFGIGDKWAHVEIVGAGKIEKSIEFNDGYSESWDEKTWVVRCECGKEFEIEQKGFKKKEHKDCGCGAAKEDGVYVIMAVSVPLSVRHALQKYAEERTNGNLSHAVVEIARQALEKNKASEERNEERNEVTHAR